MIVAAVTLALFLIAGTATLRLLPVELPFTIAGRIAFQFVIGTAAHGTLLYALAAFGVPVTRATIAMMLLAAVVVLFTTRRRSHERLAVPTAAKVLLVVPILIWCLAAAVLPVRDYDGRVTWLPKARAIAFDGTLSGPFFQGIGGLNLHNQYPLHGPLNVASIMLMTGDTSDESARLFYPLLAGAILFATRDLMVRSCGAMAAWIVAGLAWLPVFIRIEGGVLAAYNDVAAMGYLGLLFLLLLGHRDERGVVAVAAIFAASLILLKNEGVTLAAAALAAAVLTRTVKRPAAVAQIAGAAAAAIALVIWWRSAVPPAYDERYDVLLRLLPERWPRLPEAALAFARQAFDFASWSFFWPIVLVSIVVVAAGEDRKRLTLPLLLLLFAFTPYVVAFAVTSWGLEELAKVAADRLLTHLVIPAAYVIALAARSSERTQHVSLHSADRFEGDVPPQRHPGTG